MSKEPHYTCHERSSTAADARPTPGRRFDAMCRAVLRRYSFPSMMVPLLAPSPPNPHPRILSFFSSNDAVSCQARHHTSCLAEVHLAVATPAMPSHAATFA